MNVFRKIIRKIRVKFFDNGEVVIHKTSNNAPWALVSYIPLVFFYKDDKKFLDGHQSRREAMVIDEVLRELGYNVYNISFLSHKKIPDLNFELIFGLEPKFCQACIKYPLAKKIYYATGAYVSHQNESVKKLTDLFNKTYGACIPYRRTVPPHNSSIIADYILQIGSTFTIDTYPEKLRSKIHLIHQSSQVVKQNREIGYAPENNYFFMSSSGNILKGVPQIIHFFSVHPEYTIHIVGEIEPDLKNKMRHLIKQNIIFHGFLNVNSIEFIEIIKKCNFVIYPSASEGGCPGAVLNSMKHGLIPIVTKWAAFDEIENYGYLMKNVSESEIAKAIEWSKSLTPSVVLKLKNKNVKFVNDTYNLDRFRYELKSFLKDICNEHSL